MVADSRSLVAAVSMAEDKCSVPTVDYVWTLCSGTLCIVLYVLFYSVP